MRRVVLLGFMGAGKSTVGPLLAARLGWRFVDLDHEIERREGRTVAAIFERQGEPRFRALEAQCTIELAGEPEVVLAPGGGWITTPGNLHRLGPGTLTVWLQVTAEEALARIGRDRAARPLLSAPDPHTAAARLLLQRERLYRQADIAVPTNGRTADEVAHEIEIYARARSRSASGR